MNGTFSSYSIQAARRSVLMVQVFRIQEHQSLYELRRIPGRATTRGHATNPLVQMQVIVSRIRVKMI